VKCEATGKLLPKITTGGIVTDQQASAYGRDGVVAVPGAHMVLLSTNQTPETLPPDDNYFPLTHGLANTYRWKNPAYFKAGRIQDAAAAMRRALRTGTKDQTIRTHASAIERALGSSNRS
jgi:hypothetical protein